MKVALFFDIFNELGGAERVAILLAKYLKADIYTTYVNWKLFRKELKGINVKEIGLIFKNAKLLTYSEIAFRFSRLRVPKYDVYLFSRLYCISAAKNHHPNIWVSTGTHTPIYEKKIHDFIKKSLNPISRLIFDLWCLLYSFFDKKWVRNFDKILANSKNTQNQILKFYNLKSRVVYHPVETKKYYCDSYKNFYLSTTRLVKDKRVDLIIKAFKKMPDKKLIVASDGPERKNLEKLAENCSNIKFVGALEQKKLTELYAKCTATICMGVTEFLGLVPLESMASGKPCIAANAGGYKESIVHGKTGYLIKPDVKEIIRYVKLLTPELAKRMKKIV
jgi:glycosyltransferase involved in cell wall biosynthesis